MLKKILLFYPSFENGGATKNLLRIVNYLLKKKIKVILLSHNAKKNEFKFIKNLKIINNKPLKKFSFLPTRWNLALSSMINLFYCARSNFNNSIIFSMQSHIPAIIISKIIKKKIVIRNSEEPIGATIYADNRLLAIFVLILKFFFYNFADKIIAISKNSEQSLKKIVFNNKKIVLILNPYLETILKIKKINKVKTKKFTILSIGRFTYQKNLFSLINAITNISKKNNKIQLNIVGSGNQKKLLFQKTENIKNDFLKSDLFILNSFYEGLPNALIDAVNYEVPCISTDVSGARDILVNEKGGYIVPINNQRDLEDKIEHVIENYSEAKKRAKYAKSRIKRFTKINLLIFYKIFLNLNNIKK